ncbi:MAG: thiamine diphosphokinase [Lachnospiraceae bacterium]|nr:thiamine diphosphokinase [Lachnospiraceae bacterium]
MAICYIVASMKTAYKICKKSGDFVIAADAGFMQDTGAEPDVVIGDFDSLGFVPPGEHVQVHPKQKDDTDMMLAVKLGLAKGYREFVLLGGIGGRFDHTMANVQALAYLHEHGASGALIGDATDIFLIGSSPDKGNNVCNGATKDRINFPKETEGIFSVFSYGKNAAGVTISGGEYEVEQATLTDAFPLGVSNSFVGKEVTISVGEGRLIVVHEKTDV